MLDAAGNGTKILETRENPRQMRQALRRRPKLELHIDIQNPQPVLLISAR